MTWHRRLRALLVMDALVGLVWVGWFLLDGVHRLQSYDTVRARLLWPAVGSALLVVVTAVLARQAHRREGHPGHPQVIATGVVLGLVAVPLLVALVAAVLVLVVLKLLL